jgi:hypothetical protein
MSAALTLGSVGCRQQLALGLCQLETTAHRGHGHTGRAARNVLVGGRKTFAITLRASVRPRADAIFEVIRTAGILGRRATDGREARGLKWTLLDYGSRASRQA